MNDTSPSRSSRLLVTAVVLLCAVILLQLGILLQRHLNRSRPAPAPEQPPAALADAADPALEDPFLHMRRMQRQIDSLFASALQDLDRQPREFDEGWSRLEITPGFGVHDDDSAYQISIHLPGVEKSDIQVALKDSVLTIVVTQKTQTATTAGGRTIRQSSQSHRFERHLRLPDATPRSSEVKASYENGMLKITVPKRPPSDAGTEEPITIQ